MTVRVPTATYRLQVNADFTLEDAARLLPYLDQLGITDLYLSPVLEAQLGSTHGYDVTDPGTVRSQIGGERAFRELASRLRDHGLGLVLDIVPNHMAASSRNPWWTDLLEHGVDSPFAGWFDLSWSSAHQPATLDLPILGAELPELLEQGSVCLAADDDGLALRYSEHRIPLAPATYPVALGVDDGKGLSPEVELQGLPETARRALHALGALAVPGALGGPADSLRRERARAARNQFLRACQDSPAFRHWVEQRIGQVSSELPPLERRRRFETLLGLQPYRLRWWRTAAREITYRRFFDITQLVGVRVEEPAVFEATHTRFREWIRAGIVTGLRVDHIDGLHDPEAYLRQLRTIGPVYTVVEKVLAPDETLRASWDVEGTTGYDFLGVLNGWFIEPSGYRRLQDAWARATGSTRSFAEIVYEKKKLVIEGHFGGEVATLVRELLELRDPLLPPVDATTLATALIELTACTGVYRTYVSERGFDLEDRLRIEAALTDARSRSPRSASSAFDYLRRVLLLELSEGSPDRRAALGFIMHWQQLTGPAMAKGFEDTALYNFHALVSANDVGTDPCQAAVTTECLHDFLHARARSSPATMNATSTHDSKRGEDARARLNVLSEAPEMWQALLDLVRPGAVAPAESGATRPSVADELLLLQTLIGTWPLHHRLDHDYTARIQEYLRKAAREAKAHTSWQDPCHEYEQALAARVCTVLEAPRGAPIRDRIRTIISRIGFPGALNAISQVVVKTTAPGLPDFYQGSELPVFTLVDPDNRRPVDFDVRAGLLAELAPTARAPHVGRVAELLANWQDGRIKLFVTTAAIQHRRAHSDLYKQGDYIPVEVRGVESARIAAFARTHNAQWSLTIASRWFAGIVRPGSRTPLQAAWPATTLALPTAVPRSWRNVLTGERVDTDDRGLLSVASVLGILPAAILYAGS